MSRYALIGSIAAFAVAICVFFFSENRGSTGTVIGSEASGGDPLQTHPTDYESANGSYLVEEESSSEATADPAAASENELLPVFSSPSVAMLATLEQWLDEIYLPAHDAPEMVVRTNFVSVDTENFKDKLLSSLPSNPDGDAFNGAAVQLDVFPDRSYSVVTYRYRMGSGGYSNIGAHVIGTGSAGNERFGFQVSPDGRISGWGATSTGKFTIVPTPEAGVVLIVETNRDAVKRKVTVD